MNLLKFKINTMTTIKGDQLTFEHGTLPNILNLIKTTLYSTTQTVNVFFNGDRIIF